MKISYLIIAAVSSITALKCGCCDDKCQALGMFVSINNIPAKCTRKNAIGCVPSGDLHHCISNSSGGCVLVSTDGSAFAPELNHNYPPDGRKGDTVLPIIDGSNKPVTTIIDNSKTNSIENSSSSTSKNTLEKPSTTNSMDQSPTSSVNEIKSTSKTTSANTSTSASRVDFSTISMTLALSLNIYFSNKN